MAEIKLLNSSNANYGTFPHNFKCTDYVFKSQNNVVNVK